MITRTLRVAAVQMRFARRIDDNLAKIQRAATTAARKGADVVLFPECATTGYACDFHALNRKSVREALHAVASFAAALNLNVLVGSPVFAGRKLYNSLLVFNRRGRLAHAYAKCQLVEADRRWFTPGDSLALFAIDRIPATAIICHERRYPELVRLPVMAGAQIIFHPNAGMDALAVSRAKRKGRDGMPARAFENAAYYVFANSVGPQAKGKWSAGDSKIVAPDGSFLRLADNRSEDVIVADLDLTLATRKYAMDSLRHPRFLVGHWRRALAEMRRKIRETDQRFRQSQDHRV
jgi:predicted amidohydrolase